MWNSYTQNETLFWMPSIKMLRPMTTLNLKIIEDTEINIEC